MTKTIPDGYPTGTPWLISKDTAGVHNEDGSIGRAEVRIGDAVVMMSGPAAPWPS